MAPLDRWPVNLKHLDPPLLAQRTCSILPCVQMLVLKQLGRLPAPVMAA